MKVLKELEKLKELIYTYKIYIDLLSEAYDNMFLFANTHGYTCTETEIKIGQQLRDEIKRLEEECEIDNNNI